MGQISHKQAIQWIDLRADGLLTENQTLLLAEHLTSCDACRLYAAEMESLPARLQNKFRTRWDEKASPSQKVLQSVTAQAGNIRATDRLSSGIRWFVEVAMLVLLGIVINFAISYLPQTSTPATGPEVADRLLVFAAEKDGNYDIYTIHADGSGLTRLTEGPDSSTNPVWSPDGKHIAFQRAHDGFSQIYSMNPDGSNVTQLTQDKANHYFTAQYVEIDFSPWSPDGSKLLSSENVPNERNRLSVIDVYGESEKLLFTGPDSYFSPSWSPDGQHIAFLTIGKGKQSGDANFQLYIINADGSNLINITSSLSEDEQLMPYLPPVPQSYAWSQDGQSIAFLSINTANKEGIIYEANLDGSNLVKKISNPRTPFWWDITSLMADSGGGRLFQDWYVSAQSKTFEHCQSPNSTQSTSSFKRSFGGNFVFASRCSGGDWWLYWANLDGTVLKQLYDSPLPSSNFTGQVDSLNSLILWSPDDRYIAFRYNIQSPKRRDLYALYILDVEKALADPSSLPIQVPVMSVGDYNILSWQPVVNPEVVQEEPTPVNSPAATDIPTLVPTDTPVAIDTQTVAPTQTPVATDTPTSESTPSVITQEGLIAFVSTQNGNSDIYTMQADGSGVTNLTNDPAEDVFPAWSPDGKRIAFVSNRDGNEDIYVMNVDGSALTRLTEDPASEVIPVWSPDSTRIAYALHDSDGNVSRIYIVDATGQNRRHLTDNFPGPAMVWPQAWSPDGRYFFFHSNLQISKVDINSGTILPVTPQGDAPSEGILSKDGSKLLYLDWCSQSSTEFCARIKTISTDGTDSEIKATVRLQKDCPLSELIKWSPDQTKILFAFYCEGSGGWLYIANADGSDFKPLTSYPSLYNTSGFDWSPDSQSVIFSSALDNAKADIPYLLNIDDTLQNPDLHPTPLNTSASQISFFAWQPLP